MRLAASTFGAKGFSHGVRDLTLAFSGARTALSATSRRDGTARTGLSALLCSLCRCGLLLVVFLTGCRQESSQHQTTGQTRVFSVTGTIIAIQPDGKTAIIQHGAVSNYMPAMTMPFVAREPAELRGLAAGDTIAFHLVVTPDDGWIEHIEKLNQAPLAPPVPPPAPTPTSRIVVLPPELEEGDALPDYRMTNELGQAIDLSSFKGQVIAFTFFFTHCPFPTACPLLSSKFSQVTEKLLKTPGAPAQWHLFSISFDPTNDTPALLQDYAQRYHYDPAHWSFVTGSLPDITDLADRCGEQFDLTGGTIPHNFRTVVVDASGRIRRIIPGNSWYSDYLVEEMVKASR